jgi:hypothetical protein
MVNITEKSQEILKRRWLPADLMENDAGNIDGVYDRFRMTKPVCRLELSERPL